MNRLKILVCVKQVPDTTEIKIDPVTNTLIRNGVPSIVNPFDKNALEAALQLKDKYGAEVTVLSMGPGQAAEALREATQWVLTTWYWSVTVLLVVLTHWLPAIHCLLLSAHLVNLI